MSKKIILPEERDDLINYIREINGTHDPSPDYMDHVMAGVKAVINEKKKAPWFNIPLNRLKPAAGIGFAALAALTVLIIIGFSGIIDIKGKTHEIRITRFSKGLDIERNSLRINYENNPVINPGDTIINESGIPAVFAAENSFRALLSPDGRAELFSAARKDKLETLIRLEKGTLDLHVKKLGPDESFKIICADKTVSVIGTVFRVSLTNNGLLIAAEEGEVSVLRNMNDLNPLHIAGGRQVFIPDRGGSKLLPISKNNSSALSSFSREGLSRLSSKTALLVIKTTGSSGTVFINGDKLCRTPAGMEIHEKKIFDLEIAGDNGLVTRFLGTNLQSDSSLSIDLNHNNNPLSSVLTDNGQSAPKMELAGELLTVIKGKTGFIYNLNSKNINRLSTAEGEWKLPPVVNNGRIVLLNSGGSAECYNTTGQKLWELSVPGTLWYNALCACNDTYASIATVDRGITIFDYSGRLIRHIETAKAGPGYSSPILDQNNILYYINESGRLTSYSVRDGREIWQAPLPSISAHPLFETDLSIIIFFREKGSFTAFSKSDGRLLWTYNIPEIIRQEVRLTANDGILTVYYNINRTGKLWSIDLISGRLTGKLQTAAEIDSVLQKRDTIWVATSDLLLISYDPLSYNIKRRIHLERKAFDLKMREKSLIVLYPQGIEEITLN